MHAHKYSIHRNSIWFKLVKIQCNSTQFQAPSDIKGYVVRFKSTLVGFRVLLTEWIEVVSNVTTGTSSNQLEQCHICRNCIVCVWTSVCNHGFVCAAFTNHETKLKWHGVCFGDYHRYPSLMLEVIPIALWVICSLPWTPCINTQTTPTRPDCQINCWV